MTQTLEFEIKEKIESLKAKILEKHPLMPNLLQEIHRALSAQPEQVTLLSEEEMNVIIQGLEAHTNTFLMTAAATKTPSKSVNQRIKNLGLAAFGG